MNLAHTLRRSAARSGDKPALVFHGRQMTYAQLDASADAAAAGLLGLGLKPGGADRPGDRVALLLGNEPAFCEALYGIWRAGLIGVPINPTSTADEVAHMLSDCGARAIVVSAALVSKLDGIQIALPALEHVLVSGTSEPLGGSTPWRQLLELAEPDLMPAGEWSPESGGAWADTVALLQYTSGTTGRPKGAMLTHGNLLANHEQMGATKLAVGADDVILCVLPLFHIYALNVAMAYGLAQGGTLLLVERFDPVTSLGLIESGGATVIIGAPPMYVAWVNLPTIADHDLSGVRFAVSGAAPLPGEVLQRFSEGFGIPIWEGYGLTETSPVITSSAMDDEPRLGVGRPLPQVELRLVDDLGEPVRSGDPGEVSVRGPNVFGGYWEQPEATAEALRDGWLRTGDIGYAWEGHLHLIDRKRDLILVSGFNVYPREVEDVLYRHPKIAEAAVVGAPHPYTGECVKAVVVLADGVEATAEEIIAHCRESLARFKCPEVVEFTDELPRLPSGKILRRKL